MDLHGEHHARRMRIGMTALVVLAIVFTAAALFAKYRLESFSDLVLERTSTRTGMRIRAGSVALNGLRGLRIDNLGVTYNLPHGPTVTLDAPTAFVFVNVVDLFYKEVTIDRVQLDNATIRVVRPAGTRWMPADAQWHGAANLPPDLPGMAEGPAFRVMGTNCRLEVGNVIGTSHLGFTDFDFDVVRLKNTPAVTATMAATLDGAPNGTVEVDSRFVSLADFDLRAQARNVAADDINRLLPASSRFVETGSADLNIRLGGFSDGALVVAIDAPFRHLAIRDQPEFIEPASGTLTALANYDPVQRTLNLVTANARSDQVSGSVSGSIALVEDRPVFDLRLGADRLPVANLVNMALQDGQIERHGELSYEFHEPYEAGLTLRGTPEDPVLGVQASISAADLAFVPVDPRFPAATVTCAAVQASWDSENRVPAARMTIVDGRVTHQDTGLTASALSGGFSLDGTALRIAPLNATILGRPWVVQADYDIASQQASIDVSGSAQNLGDSPVASLLGNVRIGGDASFHVNLQKGAAGYGIAGELDASQTEVTYAWWFRKPAGLAGRARFAGTLAPLERMELEGVFELGSSPVSFSGEFLHAPSRESKWRPMRFNAASEAVDVALIGRCLRFPYRITGGTLSGSYAWTSDARDEHEFAWTARSACNVDQLTILAEGAAIPMALQGVTLNTHMTRGGGNMSSVELSAEEAAMPTLGATWFHPIRQTILNEDPELSAMFPPVPREWVYDLSAARLTLPPWEGTDFSGEGFHGEEATGLRSYRATVGDGAIKGSYTNYRDRNQYETQAEWETVPATYFLRHLNSPEVLSGPMSGRIAYSRDRDDPASLRGDGEFTVHDGRFDADFLLSKLGGTVETLPPSLAFSELSADLQLDGNTVRTPRVVLRSPGIGIDGTGHFVYDGDMDYRLKVAVAPDTAEQIPVLRDSFTIQGHRLAQQDITLEFRVSGPTLDPKSELTGLPPASITLVSGALEVTSEALRIIDVPRKILFDLLKIGGGLMGAARPQPE